MKLATCKQCKSFKHVCACCDGYGDLDLNSYVQQASRLHGTCNWECGYLIPGIGIWGCIDIVEEKAISDWRVGERSIFLDVAEQGGTTRPSVQPDGHRVRVWIIGTQHEYVIQLFACARHVQVATVLFRRECAGVAWYAQDL